MKIYKTNEEVKKDIVNGVLDCKGDVKFECNVDIEASINARDINAWDINAGDINAEDIKYNAFCNVYNSIKCKSIKAKREIHNKPVCLEGKLEIIENLQKREIEEYKKGYNQCLKDFKIKNELGEKSL